MRYTGSKAVVENIEQELKTYAKCFERKKINREEQLYNSVVNTRVLEVMTVESLFPVKFLYNGRDNNALVDIRDQDMGWLCKISPNIIKLIAQLEPQFIHRKIS